MVGMRGARIELVDLQEALSGTRLDPVAMLELARTLAT
jgi:hypothetical protein